jgi:hypothetical protein
MSEREAPTGDPEQGADPRVLALLRNGAPANGIDLAPWWRANAAALAVPAKRTSRSLQTWMQFAAVFVIGVSLGVAGGRGTFASPSPANRSTQTCQFNEKERSDLAAVLDASAQVHGVDWSPRRTVALTLCSTCHNGRSASSL